LIGCGTGASALPAAQAVGPNGLVIGVDWSARLLDRARDKAKALGPSNVEFQCADMTSLGYPDGRFDALVSVFSIFFVPDMEGLVPRAVAHCSAWRQAGSHLRRQVRFVPKADICLAYGK
jgi:ubiquinone/menaquinone biosynthesis C-methylase UbiE